MFYMQVQCSVLPELGAKKSTSVRGASGPVNIEVPLLITPQDSSSVPGTSASALGDWQAVPEPGTLAPLRALAVSAADPTNSAQSATPADIDSLSEALFLEGASAVGMQQEQVPARGTRAGRNKRKLQSAKETHAAAVADVAESSGVDTGSKRHKPDLQPLRDVILRLAVRHESLSCFTMCWVQSICPPPCVCTAACESAGDRVGS